jgi:hypothetical protein
MAVGHRASRPHWYGVPARALFVTFLLTLLSFAVTLLVTLLATVVTAALRHSTPSLPFAYRHVAFPAAVLAASIALVVSLAVEVRHFRQAKALDRIARASR